MDRRNCMQLMAGAGCGALGFPVCAGSSERLRIGLTAVILADQVAFLSRCGRYLSERVGCEVSFVARESYQSILELLASDQIDVAWICGYPYVRDEANLSLFAVPLYQDKPEYQSYLIRAKASKVPIKGWTDLRGRVLVYSDPLSNSGWLVAQAQLAKVHLRPRDLKRTFFAHGHRNVAEAVAARLADAGAIDGYVWETMRLQGMAAVAQTEVVWKSDFYGFPPLVTKKGSNHPKVPGLQAALLTMHQDEVGRELLQALNLTGFTKGAPALFDSIRRQALTIPGSGVVS
ncbi:MAG: phosphonate ABC transporter substrate-binding protein [Curvibacter sp. GWA2_64_110]|nr:MAG: phosphonate ABC transporter substrate-binding protein [Curvibacter sp. GWA2_64_110]HCY15452.1 phosphonate ABC transporter substrate-binding protein [Curvibacter sp.]